MPMHEPCAGRKSELIVRLLVLGVALATAGAGIPAFAAETREMELRFSPADVRLEPAADGTVAVHYRGAVHAAEAPGAPALPAVIVYLEAPADATAGEVTVEVLATEPLGKHALAAAPVDHPADRPPAPAPPLDPALTERTARAALDPATRATFLARGALRGRNLLAFRVHPVRFDGVTGELELVTAMRLRCALAPAAPAVLPRHRVAPVAEERFRADLAPVLARHGIAPPASGAFASAEEVAGPGPFQPTFRPTTDGSPVEYVIITADALKTAFQPLADWKTQKGMQAVVRTVEWIDQTYPNGVDRAERIRFFIRDAYQNWGTLYVLLGGDTDVIPARYGATTMFGGELIPADYYYACLEGNWNADGDTRFGEGFLDAQDPGDACDLFPEMYVGRAPVTSLAQVADFVDKTYDYDRTPPSGNGYPASILYLAERLFDELDGAEIAEEADDLVPAWFKRVKLYEEFQDWPGSLPETYRSVVDSVNHGFGIVHHVGHGFRNTMAIGNEVLTNADADALANVPRNSVVFSINCSSASIDFNSIGERWVKNPTGGSIAYIGTSRLAFVSASRELQLEWFATVFQDSVRNLGGACALSRLPFVPLADDDNGYRWTAFALTLLGDPEVDLATRNLLPLSVAHPPTYTLGSGTYTATVTSTGGAPVAGARVTLWKSGQAYARGTTGANGAVTLPFTPETAGPAVLTVHRSNYAVYTATVNVLASPSTHVYANGIAVNDDAVAPSDGDGDGLADAGESIEFSVTLRNGGAVPLTGVFAILSDVDPDGHLTLTDNSAMYGTINPGQSNGGEPFVVAISPHAPYAFQPVLNLQIVTNQGTFADAVVLPIRRGYLEHLSHAIDDAPPRGDGDGRVEPDEEIWYRISLRNTGQETGFVVKAGLAVVKASTHLPEPLATASDTSSTFGTIAPGATVAGDRFVFELGPSLNPASVLLKVAYRDVHGAVRTEFLDLVAPPAPDSLLTFGSPGAILLRWARPPDRDVLGYDVHRATNLNGPYTKVNAFLGEGSATYEDRGLAPLTRYYYRVVARDSSINASGFSDAFSGSTNPPIASGWPLEVGQQASSSLKIANTAGGSDNELFVGAEYMYGWHADGTEIVDGDDDARTSGVYAPDGYHVTKAFSATAALGDMDLDGRIEVANVGWTVPNAYIWDDEGDLKPGWPKSLLGDFNWPSPVLVDLNGDDDLELVVFAAKEGRLFAWHHTGAEVFNGDNDPTTNGVLFVIPGGNFCYSSPAVGNLDQDADPEIVFGLNVSTGQTGPVYAVNRNGTLVSGWPVHTGAAGAPSAITSSPALGDLDKNGTLEVVIASERNGGRVHVLRNNGTNLPGWPKDVPCFTAQVRTSSPVLADIDNDTFLDVVFLTSNGLVYAWTRTGAVIPGFPVTYATGLNEATQSTPAIGDIDDDGRMEIVFGDETGKLHAYNHNGTPVSGFPIQLNGEVRGTPFIWDVDNDGLIEVGVAGWDANAYIWDLPYAWNPSRIPWPFFRHDAANTGCVTSEIMPVGVGDPGPLGAAPRMARVHPVYPNPIRSGGGRFAFDVPGPGAAPVTLRIYDVAGRMVAEVLKEELIPGAHVVDWNGTGVGGRELGPGVYFYRTHIGDFSASRKLTILK